MASKSQYSMEMDSNPVKGYPRLACQMSLYPETAIVRRFGELNVLNLLYLQAELVHLEEELQEHQRHDTTQLQRANFSRDWFWLNASLLDNGNNDQIQTLLAIRGKLKEYNEAVIQLSATTALPRPPSYDLKFFQQWLERPNMGNQSLIGKDRNIWGSSQNPQQHAPDLIALQPCHHKDRFSMWMSARVLSWFHGSCWHRVKKSDLERGFVVYTDDAILRRTSYISTVVASILPIASIVILYYIQSMPARLGAISTFTLTFSLCLTFFTGARTGEIFAATATFAAIQVVFVSTNGAMISSGGAKQ